MKVAGLEITRKKGSKKADSGSTVSKALNVSNFGAFYKDVEHLHNNGGGDVTILKLKTPSSNPKRVDELDISAVIEEEDFLQFILDKYKDSIYKFQLWTAEKDLYSDHYFTLGEPKEKGSKGKSKGGKKSGKKSQNFQEELTLRLIDKAFDSKTSDGDQWQRTLELAKALKGDNGITAQDMMNFGIQIAGLFQQGQGGSTLDEAVTLLELMQRLQPQQQQDEGWGQLVPMVTGLIQSFRPGQGGATPQQAQELQVIKQQLQSLIAGAAAGAPAVTEQPPAPGASAVGGLGGAVESADSPAPPARAGTEAYFHERFLNPFRQDVTNGESDKELAYQIVSMCIYARDRMPDNLPPIVADFVNASTMSDHDAALQRFFAAIPELANLTQKQIGIRTALIMNFMPVFQESAEEEVQDLQESESIIHIEQEEAVEEAIINDADTGVIEDADAAEGTGDEDLGANARDHSEVEHESVPGEVG